MCLDKQICINEEGLEYETKQNVLMLTLLTPPALLAELRAEVEVIEQMSSSGSSSSDSASASGSGDDSSSDGEHDTPRLLSQLSPNRPPMANGGADRQQGNNQLMNTLREYLIVMLCFC